jgi:hypothetical protein
MPVPQRGPHLWVTDITEHPTGEGKVYCAAVMDARQHLGDPGGWRCSFTRHPRLPISSPGPATAIFPDYAYFPLGSSRQPHVIQRTAAKAGHPAPSGLLLIDPRPEAAEWLYQLGLLIRQVG